MIDISPSAQIQVDCVGYENTKIIVIDDLACDVEVLRRAGGSRKMYSADGVTSYPGVRAALPDSYVGDLVRFCKPLIRREFGIAEEAETEVCMAYFSLLTALGRELSVSQRMPHFDTTSSRYFAILHYLNEGDFGGTGFFRHIPTGFERISRDNKDLYQQSVTSLMAVKGLPEPRYVEENSAQHHCYKKVGYQSNRLVIYPGNLLHSGLVDENRDVCDDPAQGRLTANVFLQFGE